MNNCMKRIWAFLLSAALLVTPIAGSAEGNYEAGSMAKTLLSDAYAYGNQIDVQIAFDAEASAEANSRRASAAASLLKKSEISLSFYDDYGTGRIHGLFTLDGLELLEATALILPDGSIQITTSLTDNTVLTFPAGTVGKRSFDLMDFFYGSLMRKRTDKNLSEMSARERLQATASDELMLILDHLLGWVSYTQREREDEFYMFDKTDIEATETRDAVAQRMIGQVYAAEFTELFWNIAATTDAQMGDFQQAIADCLAELGVTGVSAQQFADALFTVETIDPSRDFVTPTHALPNDGALCTKRNVSYFFKKLVKSCERIWDECNDEMLTLIVSYDSNGRMVGFDAELPVFTDALPYEGNFSWSLKSDEYGQTRETTHGELQVYDGNRIMGDALIIRGRDVDGVCESGIDAAVTVSNRESGESWGAGIAGSLVAVTGQTEDGADRETLTGDASAFLLSSGEKDTLLTADLTGASETPDGTTAAVDMTAGVSFPGILDSRLLLSIRTVPAEEMTIAGGQALYVTELDEASLSALADTVEKKIKGMVPRLMLHPSLLTEIADLVAP